MEKAKLDFTTFLKNNAWGIFVGLAVIISNFAILSAKTDDQAKMLIDHEARIRSIEMKQEMIVERLNNIQEDTKFLRQLLDREGRKSDVNVR